MLKTGIRNKNLNEKAFQCKCCVKLISRKHKKVGSMRTSTRHWMNVKINVTLRNKLKTTSMQLNLAMEEFCFFPNALIGLCCSAYKRLTLSGPRRQLFWRRFELHNSPADWTIELFKPFTHSTRLLVEIEKTFFVLGFELSVRDVTSGGVFVFLTNVFRACGFFWNPRYHPSLYSPWSTF